MRKLRRFLRGKALVVFTALVLTPSPIRAESPSPNPFTGNAQAIKEGKTNFEMICAGYCHVTENSTRPGQCPSLFDCEWKDGGSDEQIFHTIAEGVPKTQMIGFKGRLPDEMLWKIIAYLRSASKCQQDGKPSAAAAH
jgi:cytochrome c2